MTHSLHAGTKLAGPSSTMSLHLTLPQRPPASLTDLPWELMTPIITHLDIPSVLALAATSHATHASLDWRALLPRTVQASFLLAAERFPQHRARLACFQCLQLLPGHAFGDAMRRNGRGKNGIHSWRRAARVCWNCLAAQRLSGQGETVLKGGIRYRLCQESGVWMERALWCARRDGVEGPHPEPDAGQAALEKLPSEIVRRIGEMLDYNDARQLAMTSRALRKAVDPQACDIRSKFLFLQHQGRILRCQLKYKRVAAYFACYGCWAYKPRSKVRTYSPTLPYSAWRTKCSSSNVPYAVHARAALRQYGPKRPY